MGETAGHAAPSHEASASKAQVRVSAPVQVQAAASAGPVRRLQQSLGNHALAQRLTAERRAAQALRQSPARPLDASARTEMEAHLGEDLASVRVHIDPAACDALNANAYTLGEHVVFNAGAYAPHRQAGRALLAHELAHVIQQRRGFGANSPPRMESEARRIGQAAAHGAGPIAVREGGAAGLALEEKSTDPQQPDMTVTEKDGRTIIKIDKIEIVNYVQPEKQQDLTVSVNWTSSAPKTIDFSIQRLSTTDVIVSRQGLAALAALGYHIVPNFHTTPAFVGERASQIQLNDWPPAPRPQPPTARPPKPAAKPAAAQPAAPSAPAKTDPLPATAAPGAPSQTPAVKPDGPAGNGAASAQDLDQRVAKVRANLKSLTFNIHWSNDIIDAFRDLSPADFQQMQDRLGEKDMNEVFGQLSPFQASLVGSLGPVSKGGDKLNDQRIEYILTVKDWGSTRQTFYHWMFDTMSLEDARTIVQRLAAQKRLHETLLTVPDVVEGLVKRGVDPAAFKEQDTTALEGVGRGLEKVWAGAWSSTVFGSGPTFEQSYLPKKYQETYSQDLGQDWNKATEPMNAAKGAASYVTLGVSDLPVGVYEASKATVQAGGYLWEGKTGAATEKLTPVVLMVLAALIGRKISKAATATALEDTALVDGRSAPALKPPPAATTALAAPATASVPEWRLRPLGKTADGLDRYMGLHASGEYVEFVVDVEKQTIRGTHIASGATITFENGRFSRGPAALLPAGEGAMVGAGEGTVVEAANVAPPPSRPAALPPAPANPAAVTAPPQLAAPSAPPALGPGSAIAVEAATAEAKIGPTPSPQPVAAAPSPAAQAAVPTPPATLPAPAPITKTTVKAAARLAEAQDALAAAQKAAAAAREKVRVAQENLGAAQELHAGVDRSASTRQLVKEAQNDLRAAQAALKPAALNETLAAADQTGVLEAQRNILIKETEIAKINAQIRDILRPPDGFSQKDWNAGRRPNVPPRWNEPQGRDYDTLNARLNVAKGELANWERDLTTSLKDQVNAATPGAGARPAALQNAQALGGDLAPIGGMPIDVTTGQPMTTANWATDHIMSRSEIASDPRFARLSPAMRDKALLQVPKNYLPITAEANSSKGALSVDEWIRAREQAGAALPPKMVAALQAADKAARAEIEAFFVANAGK